MSANEPTDSGLDETIDAPAVAADYPDMVPVDPKHYVLADEIARGGMGRIRVARDRRLGRRIAIKEVLVNRGDVARRFEREARITARLEHPAIVSIHEAGAWPSGEPFMAMRLVSGRSLDDAIAGAKTARERMALVPNVLAVADAIAYAHEQQVIHRDLKPKNVLVGKFGETVVIDWGLAKDLAAPEDAAPAPAAEAAAAPPTGAEDTLASEPPAAGSVSLTIDGAVMGTPAYMPPEQARGGHVDARADVYAIGAILYHVLAGRAPIVARTLARALEDAVAHRIDPLAELAPEAPAELVAIAEKAMRADADDRYPTAAELAADLRRFQTGQLVGAHRYSARELLGKWMRKHRTAVIASGVAFTVLVVVGAVGVQRIVHERELAEEARAVAEEQRARAERSRAESEDLVGFMLGDLSAQLAGVGRLGLLDAVTARAVDYYGKQPDATLEQEAKHATALATRAAILEAQNELADALARTREALALRKDLVAHDPARAAWQTDLAQSYRKLSELLKSQGDAAGALAAARDGLAATDAFAQRDPGPQAKRELALAHERLASVLPKDEHAMALVELRTALALRDAIHAAAPDNVDWLRDVSIAHERLGRALQKDDGPGAIAELRAAIALARQITKRDPARTDHLRDLAILDNRIGDALYAQHEHADALVAYREAVDIDERMVKAEPNELKWLRDLSISRANVGDVLADSDNAAALAEYTVALAIATQLALHDPRNAEWQRDLAISHETVGKRLSIMGQAANAVAEFQASRDILAKLAAADPANARWRSDLADTLTKLAAAYDAHGDTKLAADARAEAAKLH